MDFTSWENALMHYGVPGMRKGVRRKTVVDLSKRAGVLNSAIKNPAIGSPQKDRKMADSIKTPERFKSDDARGITREDRFKQGMSNTNPQDIINARRKKLRNFGR